MKKFAVVAALVSVAACALTACGSADDTGGGKLKVGVMFPGSLSDDGFMQSGYEGYQRIENELADKVSLTKVEQVATADYQQVLTRLATGANLVVSFGGQTDSVLRQVAPAFPNVKFVEIGGPADAAPMSNLAYYDPVQADGGFLAGAYAALVTKTGKVGFVGGMELPAIVKTAKAFEQGAAHVKPDVTVLPPQYVGDFNDVAKARQAAQAQVGAGAGAFGQQLNLGRQGLAQAAKEGQAVVVGGPLVKACGSEAGFAGYVKSDTGAELEFAVDAVLNDTFAAEQVRFGIASATGATDFVLCDAAPETVATMDKVKADLASGVIVIQ
ncbi:MULTISPECIES: BMP family ABC transporter substrate-binding protein [Nocardia]|uniref:BMP family ABC transporter substrate-binding protein n=1 Tax=Nocardia TaxID=1817 RepID=UPI000D694056|nr:MULTISPECIES: BMP family ABC transporter substrate-binding protein [Nocardia]